MSIYKILSLDGGGIRGLLTARLLERLTRVPGLERAFDSVDLIAGNSSGALIGLAMALERAQHTPMKLALPRIRALFEDGENVFGQPRATFVRFWLRSKFFGDPRHERFKELDHGLRLRHLGTDVLITAFDLDNEGKSEHKVQELRRWTPKIFHSFKLADGSEPTTFQDTSDREQRVADVAYYSSAAPAYFPTANGYIDGGVYANNPSMCALAQILDKRYEPMPKPRLDEITMFSVGAGRGTAYIGGKKEHNWGAAQWLVKGYVDLTMDASVGTAEYECRQLLERENYVRCEVDFPCGESFSIDAVEHVEEIRKVADAVVLDPYVEWLHRHWAPRPAFISVPEPTSKHLLGATELTCLIPIKQGFSDAFETHSYATRIRIVLGALHALRQASREVVPARVFPDVVDVIRSIHSFRLSILPDTRTLLLSVNFDRPWEPYMRIVQRDLGALLDLLLINCEGYELHTSKLGYEAFSSYIRAHQVNTDLFYVGSTHTVDDVGYLTQLETRVRTIGGTCGFDAGSATLRVTPPEELAEKARHENREETARQGLLGLAVFYKLRELYLPETPDEEYLKAAVLSALKTFKPDTLALTNEQKRDYADELEWFGTLETKVEEIDRRQPDLSQVQSGIIQPYRYKDQVDKKESAEKVTHGCLLFARVEDVGQAKTFLLRLADRITPHGAVPSDGLYVNAAFTTQGLKRLGVSEAEMGAFPKEFREGMEARAGLLGDVGSNHPDHWELPAWNWDGVDARPAAAAQVSRVHLSTIDVVIQIRAAKGDVTDADYVWETHALHDDADKIVGAAAETGVRVMSVQPMVNHRKPHGDKARVFEHFDYRDNISQPIFNPNANGKKDRDEVKLGEFLLGYESDRQDPPFYDRNDERALPFHYRGGLLDNGTFLVIRKLEQHVGRLEQCVAKFVEDNPDPEITPEWVFGKLMGREKNGCPVTAPKAEDNNFTYKNDNGARCPLTAHIRRGNPRTGKEPRIARRGMSYGPRYRPGEKPPEAGRGMMFMAYNASIAEQFETIQRWMTAGNSTGDFSGRTDPFLRVGQKDRDDIFVITHGGKTLRMNLGREPFVSLKWGMYLFVPSIAAIKELAKRPKRPDIAARAAEVVLGQRVMEALKTEEDWRAILEDTTAVSSGRTAAVCAAIRKLHGGAIRTPGNLVLVATEQLAMQVLGDDRTFSVSEYRNRMCQSIGDIYLGHDSSDPKYKEWSTAPNEVIGKISEREAFGAAHATAESVLQDKTEGHTEFPIRLPLAPVIDEVLAQLSADYFGVPDADEPHVIVAGGQPKNRKDRTVHCPFHTLAPSRYIFSSPRPRMIVELLGQLFGSDLHKQIEVLAKSKWPREWPQELPPISRAVWNTSLQEGKPNLKLFASLLAGVMEGFLPTVYGNFLKTMHVWLTNKTFWRVQQELLGDDIEDEYARAEKHVKLALMRAMQARPVPDMVYRTATRRAWLGNVSVEKGDRVVVLIGSVTQEVAASDRKDDVNDVYAVFGGNRDSKAAQPGAPQTFKSLVPHPTHACPGYEMGMGVLLGTLTAVLEAGPFAPTATPLVVNLTDRREVPRVARTMTAPA